jgi:hypothetical protein
LAAGVAVEHENAASDCRERDPGPAGDHPVPASEHPEPQSLAAVDDRPRPQALLRELPAYDERRVAVVRSLVGDAQRAGSELPERGATEVDHDDTFTAIDGQRPGRRLARPGAATRDREGAEGA